MIVAMNHDAASPSAAPMKGMGPDSLLMGPPAMIEGRNAQTTMRANNSPIHARKGHKGFWSPCRMFLDKNSIPKKNKAGIDKYR